MSTRDDPARLSDPDAALAGQDWLLTLANRTAMLACFLCFGLSVFTLQMLGINYAAEGGSFLTKIHPSSYLAMLALLLHGIRFGNPVTWLAVTFSRFPLTAIFLAILCGLVVFTTLVQKTPLSLYVDTFFAPMMFFWLLVDLGRADRAALGWILHAFMFANAVLGLAELKLGFRVTPMIVFTTQFQELTSDWRSSAFLGHPLSNSLVTAMYILAISLTSNVKGWVRVGMILLQLAAMNCFGGRAATVMVLFGLAVILGWHMLRLLQGARFSLLSGAIVVAGVPIGLGVLALAFEAGVFDLFIERFINDGNSAKARVLMFKLFDGISLDAFLFGSDIRLVLSRQYLEGFEFGIESFWIASVVNTGLLMSILLWIGMFLFFYELVIATSPRTLAVVALCIAIASTSLSLAGKGSMLTILVAFAILYLTDDKKIRKA